MIGESGLVEAADHVLRLAEAGGAKAEVCLQALDSSLTRFANNEIHQHVRERDVTVQVRVASGKRVGTASGNGLDDDTLRRVVQQAADVARLQRENPDFPGFPGPYHVRPVPAGVSEDTLEATPEARAERVGVICRRASGAGFTAAGACSTAGTEILVANSSGTRDYHLRSHARLLAVVSGSTSSGYGVRQGTSFDVLDAAAVAEEATGKAERGRDPGDIEPGEYDVLLEPYAAEDILRFIAGLGLQGRAVQEKTSFAAGKIGQRLLSEQITLRDDPLNSAGLIQPFDAEGVPKQPLTLVNAGTVAAVTYDSLTAAKEGKASTGHAPFGQGFYGPAASHLTLQQGAQTRDDLIRKIDRGLLITRFWYTRAVHPLSVTVTGTTRDSTFLIERGEITRPVKNLRFTQSYVEALNNVIGVGNASLLVGDSYGNPIRTPAIAFSHFRFTGKSDY